MKPKRPGEPVKAGEVIGRVAGSGGPRANGCQEFLPPASPPNPDRYGNVRHNDMPRDEFEPADEGVPRARKP